MKIKLKDGKYIDVDFWSFGWKSFLAQLVFMIILWIISVIIFVIISTWVRLSL